MYRQRYVYSQIGFPVGRIINLNGLAGDIYQTGLTKCAKKKVGALVNTDV